MMVIQSQKYSSDTFKPDQIRLL